MDTKQNQQLYSVNKEDQDQLLGSNFLYSSGSIILTDGTTKYRFLMILMMMTAFGINQNCYDLNNVGTPDYLYYIEPFFYVILFMSSIRWIEEWGLYRTMIFAMILQTFALWFGRSFAFNYIKIFETELVGPTVGEFLNSAAQVYMFNALTKFTGLWFAYKERVIATTLILIANYVGNLTTNWYLFFTPSGDGETLQRQYEHFRYYLEAYWLALAIFNFVILLVFILAFRAAPNHIPSRSQQVRGNPFNFRNQMTELLEEKENKIYLGVCAFLLVYQFCSPYNFRYFAFEEAIIEGHFATIINDVQPYCIIGGLLVTGIVLSLTQKYKLILIVLIASSLTVTLLGEVSFLIGQPILLYISYSLQGFFIGGLKIAIYETVTEFCYPQSAALAVGLLHLIAKPCILALTVISDNADDAYAGIDFQNHIFNDVIQFIFIACLGVCLALVAKFELKTPRLECDE